MKKVLVIMGGISTERDVSLKSGKAVAEALRFKGFEVEELDIKNDNISKIQESVPDVVFLALHGKGGEDGCIQGVLEWMNIPYTGSGVKASAICMDKILTKKMLLSAGINTPDFLEFNKADNNDCEYIANKILTKFKLPVILKAASQGSSIGVSKVTDEISLAEEVEKIFQYGDSLLVEEFIQGIEVTVPILGNSECEVLPIVEIVSANTFYDFQSKYTNGMCEHIIPARIIDDVYKKTEQISLDTYKLLGCRGLSRVDVILKNNTEPYVIEVNTLPGMTEMSLFPDSARFVGLKFPDLVEKIVNLALER